jgi:hypothetical protein
MMVLNNIISIWNKFVIKLVKKVTKYYILEKKTKNKNPWTEEERKLFKLAIKEG